MSASQRVLDVAGISQIDVVDCQREAPRVAAGHQTFTVAYRQGVKLV